MGKGKRRDVSAPVPAPSSSRPVVDGNRSSSNDTYFRLNCLIEGDRSVFDVTVSKYSQVTALKELVHGKGKNGLLRDTDAKDLVLLKVNIGLRTLGRDSLPALRFMKDDEDVHELLEWDFVSDYWSEQPEGRTVHIFVKVPATRGTPTNWDTFHDTLLDKLSAPIPREFRVAPGIANHSRATRPPSNFDLHLPSDQQLLFVKWAPNLVEEGMKRLKALHLGNASVRDPGDNFWNHNDIDANISLLSRWRIVTGEQQIQTITDQRFLQPICNIASRILFYLDADPPETQAWEYDDLRTQTGDVGPPIWDTVIKLSLDQDTVASKILTQLLIERVIYAVELKSLTVAPSTFFYQAVCRAAYNIFRDPEEFAFQKCREGIKCRHAKIRDFSNTTDDPQFVHEIKKLSEFNPTPDELQHLIGDHRVINDDHADNSGKINIEATDLITELSNHPRAYVALAIMRSGAIPLQHDDDDDPVASDRIQANDTLNSTRQEQQSSPQDCKDWKWTGGDEFEEHYACVLQQLWAEMVHRDLTFSALMSLKHAVMAYRSRKTQTLYISTPFLPGARSPTLCQALLSQIISAYQEAVGRSNGSPIVVEGGDASKASRGGKDDMGRRGGRDGGSSMGAKRKNNESKSGPSKKQYKDSDANEIPVATLSAKKQLRLSKSIMIGETYMCIHDGFYDSAVTALLKPVRSSSNRSTTPEPPPLSPIPSLTHSASTGSNSSMGSIEFTSLAESELCLTKNLGRGAIGEVWKGVFSVALESITVLDIAAKVGWLADSRKHFLHEAKIYDILRKQDVQGVPVLIGVFDDISDRVPILVTTYAGQMISRVDDSLKKQFRQILRDLHKAGICHADLRKENMCCLNGRGSIIDFSHAFESSADEDFRKDMQQLEELLACY